MMGLPEVWADRAGMAMAGLLTDARKRWESIQCVALRLVGDEAGQDLIEYALVAALVGLGAVASMKTLSTKIGAAFTTIGTSLTSNV